MNVEFTEVCLKLGWKGPGTKRDILPLVLSANGHDPDYFDVPPELILDVPIVHPTWVLKQCWEDKKGQYLKELKISANFCAIECVYYEKIRESECNNSDSEILYSFYMVDKVISVGILK